MGDIDSSGTLLTPPTPTDINRAGAVLGEEILEEKKPLQGVGAYFLLWPIKVVKGNQHVGDVEREMAGQVAERIRDVTGMRGLLGERSSI
jgi:hypothetical protein